MTSISKACVYLTLATIHCILQSGPSSIPMHRESIWEGRGFKAYQIDNGDTLSPRCPISCSLKTEVRVGGSPSVSFLTDIKHNQPTQTVFIQMQGQTCWQRSRPCTGVDGQEIGQENLLACVWIEHALKGAGFQTATWVLTDQPVTSTVIGQIKIYANSITHLGSIVSTWAAV